MVLAGSAGTRVRLHRLFLADASPTMAKLDAAAVSKLLRELAQRLELAGGNPYRARAYGRAAENLFSAFRFSRYAQTDNDLINPCRAKQ
jgi:Helix-hairpin-helix domain